MIKMMKAALVAVTTAVLLMWHGGAPVGTAGSEQVVLIRVPGDGIQPEALVDGRGVLHVLYFTGEPRAGDLLYVRSNDYGQTFSTPIRVNSQPGSAIATGTIRGGQIAIGRSGRIHVAWNGSLKAMPKGSTDGHPMLYTRLNDAGTAFEPQRCLMQISRALDGGGSVAADDMGQVYVAWHG